MPIMVNPNRPAKPYEKPSTQTWADSSRRTSDAFHKASQKYGNKFEYADKYVGVGWTLNDPTAVVKQPELDKRRISNAEISQWKAFNSYEGGNHRMRTKEALKQEINNITA